MENGFSTPTEPSSCIDLEFTVDKDNLISSVLQLLTLFRPQWQQSINKIQHKVFSDGITNKLVGLFMDAEQESSDGDMVLVRIFGENTEKIIDRAAEVKNIKILQKLGFGPKLYASFSNGLAYEFFPGKTLNPDSCKAEHIYPLVAERMALLHKQHEKILDLTAASDSRSVKPMLWDKIRDYIRLSPLEFEDPVKQAKFKRQVPSKEELASELDWLETKLSKLGSRLVFCHNDLLLANILYNESKHSIHFIDFEYAAPNYQAYDVANHFCEFSGVDNFDPSRYPDETFRRQWISQYLKHFHSDDHDSDVVIEDEVDSFLQQVEDFSLASHFFWGVWALIQAAHSTIDFDFLAYSILRLAEYQKRKTVRLNINSSL